MAAAAAAHSVVRAAQVGTTRRLTLNRVKALNALNLDMVRDLKPRLELETGRADAVRALFKCIEAYYHRHNAAADEAQKKGPFGWF